MSLKSNFKGYLPIIISIVVGYIIYLIPPPQGLDLRAWKLFAIFFATILGVVIKAFPLSVMSLLGLTAASVSGAFSGNPAEVIKTSLSGFSSNVTWLVVFAFFIARGIIKTNLGSRIAYLFIRFLGKRTLGLAYGLAITDLILAPSMPSITARGGGIIAPIVRSISEAFGSTPDSSPRKIGGFLSFTAFQVNIITGAMFLTAMAGNAVAAKIAGEMGYALSWRMWALAALVPGLLSLVAVPLFTYFIYPPEIKKTPEAAEFAKTKLKELGPMSIHEYIMSGTFVLLLGLWIFGGNIFNATLVAMIGGSILLVTRVITFEDVKNEREAWDTFFWMSILITLGGELNNSGFTKWFANYIGSQITGFSPSIIFIAICLVYFYSHYFFASATAHITAMMGVFLALSVNAGLSGMIMAVVLGCFSNLFAATTHYGIGSAPIFFGLKFLDITTWWKNGFFVSVLILGIWMIIGPIWWKILGL